MPALDLVVLYERWGELRLGDGTTIRYRPTLGAVIEAGEDRWETRIQNQMQVIAPESARRPQKAATKQFAAVPAISMGESCSQYEVGGKIVRMASHVAKVVRTDGYDAHGEPIYNLQVTTDCTFMQVPATKSRDQTATK